MISSRQTVDLTTGMHANILLSQRLQLFSNSALAYRTALTATLGLLDTAMTRLSISTYLIIKERNGRLKFEIFSNFGLPFIYNIVAQRMC